MTIDKLDLINFKNFSKLSVTFESGVNLLVGSNGSGKTSILEAINVALGGFFASQDSKMQRLIDLDEVRIEDRLRTPECRVTAESKKLKIKWSRTFRSNSKANDTSGVKLIREYGDHFFIGFDLPDVDLVAPLIAYYSTQRLFKDSSQSSKQKYDAANGRKNGYLQCLRPNSIKGVLNNWLSNAVIRRATLNIKEIEKIDHVLENVEEGIRQTLITFLDLDKKFNLKVYPDPDFENEIFVYFDKDHDLPLSYYSDGFRNLVYLIFDMVWRASQLNPLFTLSEISENVFGVVTIDEIDLHLHPRWQAKAVGLLQKLFPKVQFFITTHSPTVIANFENGTLYTIIDNKVVTHVEDFFGKQIDSVLRNILGAPDRNVLVQHKIDELMRFIDKNQPNRYEPLLDDLLTTIGKEDPDIQKALSLIELKQFLKDDKDAVHQKK